MSCLSHVTQGSGHVTITGQILLIVREGGAISSAGQCRIMLAKKILHGVSGELRITSALSILGGHRMALGCSGLHANGCFNACRNCPAPKNLCQNSPALP